MLTEAGFTIIGKDKKLKGTGVQINFEATDADGIPWYFDVSGAFTTTRGGLLRTDTVWKCLGRAHVLANRQIKPVVFLTSHLPKPRSEGDAALHAAGPTAFFDAIEMLADEGRARLLQYASGGHHDEALSGFWSAEEIARGR